MIPNPPVKVNLSSGSDSYMGVAEQQFKILESIRLSTNLPILKKTFSFGGSIVAHLISSDYGSKIILMGGINHIVLVSDNKYFLYNYISDTLSPSLANTDDTFRTIDTAFDGWCSREAFNKFNGTSPTVKDFIDSIDAKFACGINKYEMSIYQTVNSFYASTGNEIKPFGKTLTGSLLLPEFSGNYYNLFGYVVYQTTASWNLFQGASLFAINPSNGIVSEPFKWIPSFFVVDKNDGYHLKPGWYYGEYPWSDYGIEDSLVSAEVKFGGILKTRKENPYNYNGWCEQVTAINGEPKYNIYFYIGTPEAGNSYTWYERATITTSNASVTIGSSLQGKTPLFDIEFPHIITNIDWWTHASKTGLPDVDKQGLVIVSDNYASVYNCSTYPKLLLETDQYIEHSVSNDGTMLSIFTGIGSIINTIHVFDLFGERSNLTSETFSYTGGAPTTLNPSHNIAASICLTGCFIPQAKSKELLISPLDFNNTPTIDTGDYDSSLSTLSFNIDGNGGIGISKLTCNDGVTAVLTVGYDECFSGSEVVVDDPDIVGDEDFLISKWNYNGVVRGVVRGNFVDASTFLGMGSGSSARYGKISMPSTFGMNMDATETYFEFGSYSGDLIAGNCVTDDFKIDTSCYDTLSCGDFEITFTATSSCGQSAELTKHYISDPLELSGTDEPIVGSVYVASEGIKPYTYSFDGGTINEATGKILTINSCGGSSANGAVGYVSVTDACSQTESIEVRLPGGKWYKHEYHYTIGSTGSDSCYTSSEPSGRGTYYEGGTQYVVDRVECHADESPVLNSQGVISNGGCPDGTEYGWEDHKGGLGVTVPDFVGCCHDPACECRVQPSIVTVNRWYCC